MNTVFCIAMSGGILCSFGTTCTMVKNRAVMKVGIGAVGLGLLLDTVAASALAISYFC